MKKNNNNQINIQEDAESKMSTQLAELSALEHKILVFVAEKIINDNSENHEGKYDIRDFYEQRGRGCNGQNYREFRDAVSRLSTMQYEIKTGGFKVVGNWFSRFGFFESGSEGILKFDDYSYEFMKKYIADSGNCECLLHMTSKYGIRLYNCLKGHVGEQDFVISLEQLREAMGIDGEKYSIYREFKRNVMAAAIFEINNHTDFLVSFKEKRTNRSVSHLLFTVSKKCIASD